MLLKAVLLIGILQVCYAPPVTKNKGDETHETQTDGLEDYIEYHRYIREVVNALESDPTFREKLEKANEDDIRSGKIANELELVSHHVRTRLDEIKRTELQRLRDLMARKIELTENNSIDDPTHHHLDHDNPHTFEIEDLKKLITRTTEDLAEADKKRRDEFKEYELQKEYEKMAKLNETTGDEHEKLAKEYKDMDEKHKKHEKLHTPGHKQQLEEVWEEQDHMQQDFNPKTFFMLHDLDSNGLWDQDEVKALFVKELDKMYAQGAPEDDMRERVEEMERMRESVFKEMDTNKDGFIDYKEFLQQTKKNDYEKDNGWQGLDEQRPFSDEELDEYIKQHQMRYPPPPGYHPGAYHPQGGFPQQPGMQHPGMQPAPGHYPPQGAPMHPQGGQMYPPGQYPPQGQMHPQAGQMPPQGQMYPQGGQMPPHGGQMPPQAQMYPQGGQMPPQGGQMYPQGGQMPPQGGQMRPQGGQMPPQGAQMHPQAGQAPPPPPQGHGQFNQGQLPQAQINTQAIPNQGGNVNYNNNQGPDLNTNEIYPDKPQNVKINAQQNVKPEQPPQQQQQPSQQQQQQQVNQQQQPPQANNLPQNPAPHPNQVPQVQKV